MPANNEQASRLLFALEAIHSTTEFLSWFEEDHPVRELFEEPRQDTITFFNDITPRLGGISIRAIGPDGKQADGVILSTDIADDGLMYSFLDTQSWRPSRLTCEPGILRQWHQAAQEDLSLKR